MDSPKHIFLFLLDAVRCDHLSLYGYPRKTTPNIETLSQQSDIYSFAFSPSSYTMAAVPSILAGKYPVSLSNLFTGGQFQDDDFESLKSLKNQGYKTAFFTANVVTSHNQTNLDRFFDDFWDELKHTELNRSEMLYSKSEEVLKAVKAYVKKNKRKNLFILIHLMEAHGPYLPEEESIFKDDALSNKETRIIDHVVFDTFRGVSATLLKKKHVIPKYQLQQVVKDAKGNIEDYQRNVNHYISQYDMGIFLQDKNLGEFFGFLKKLKLYDSSKIIITSDHGELLGEENIFFSHGILTHPALTHVPLVIKNPFQKNQKTRHVNVSLIDVMTDIIRDSKTCHLDGKKMNERTDDDLIYSYHPKSYAVIKNGDYLLVHNGDFHYLTTEGENLFPESGIPIESNFLNFKNLQMTPFVKLFKKQKGQFIENSKKDQDFFFRVISDMQKSTAAGFQKSFETFKKETDQQLRHTQKQLKSQLRELQRRQTEVKHLTQMLEEIQSARFYKLWQAYCKGRDMLLAGILGKKKK